MHTSTKTKMLLTSVMSMLVLSVTLVGATVVSAAKPTDTVAVDLDQCRNGALGDPQTEIQQCVTTGSGSAGWVNGNAGASNAHFAEGESISYRARLTGLPANAQVQLVLGYDVIHNGHDAIDFLTDKNRWQTPETTVGDDPDLPCSGVTACGSQTTIHIPAPPTHIKVDPSKTLAGGCQTNNTTDAIQQPTAAYTAVDNAGEANMELFGGTDGTFEYLSSSTPNLLDKNGDQEQQVRVTFTANTSNPVLAWGGHIASRLDWGCSDSIRSASGISGSPYHMRIKSAVVNTTPVSLGNQDRSLSASAVIFIPSVLTTTPGGSVSYTASATDSLDVGVSNAGGTADFYLYDNLTDCQANTTANAVFSSLGVTVSNGVTGTVTKTINPGPTSTTTYYWYVHYSGSTNPAVTAGNSVCSESVTITPPSASASGS